MRTTPLAAAIGLSLALAFAPAVAIPAAAVGETCDGKAATIVVPPTSTGSWVVGTAGDDVIVGTDGPDAIDGAGGNDTICALDHGDQIVGGPGDDRLFGGLDFYQPDEDLRGDVIQPGPGDDYVDLGADTGPDDIYFADNIFADQVSYADAPGPVTVDLTTLNATGHGSDTLTPTAAQYFTGIIGSPYDDVLVGGPAHDQIHGGAGDDVITGGVGDDLLNGDMATGLDHRSKGAPGSDLVDGGAGDDTVGGGWGTDELLGGEGNDVMDAQAQSHNSTLDAGPGDDYLRTAEGSQAIGAIGNDTFQVDLGRGEKAERGRTIRGGLGRDRVEFESYAGRISYDMSVLVPQRRIVVHGARFAILSGAEEFVLDSNRAKGLVTFRGGRGPELFRLRFATGFPVRAFGGGGVDTLIGGDRDDLLDGGPGRDRLYGNDGRDRCRRGELLKSCEIR